MPPLYKEALCWLVLLAVTTASYLAVTPFVGPLAGTGVFGLLGLGGLMPLLYRKRKQAVICDERDTHIAHRALVAGYSVFWLAFSLGIVGLWATLFFGGRSTVSVHVLPQIIWIGFMIFMTARAVAVIVQYRLQDAGKGE